MCTYVNHTNTDTQVCAPCMRATCPGVYSLHKFRIVEIIHPQSTLSLHNQAKWMTFHVLFPCHIQVEKCKYNDYFFLILYSINVKKLILKNVFNRYIIRKWWNMIIWQNTHWDQTKICLNSHLSTCMYILLLLPLFALSLASQLYTTHSFTLNSKRLSEGETEAQTIISCVFFFIIIIT